MAKKRQQPPEEGAPAWMATFSDLMNLLLCFFVLLFASSTMDEGKVQEIAASFKNVTFSIFNERSTELITGQMVSGGVTQLADVDMLLQEVGEATESSGETSDSEPGGGDPNNQEVNNGNSSNVASNTDASNLSDKEIENEYQNIGEEQSEEMYEEIEQLTESQRIDDMIVMDYNSQYVILDLNGSILFENASDEVREDAKVFLQKIAMILEKYKYCIIEIEGHTDNVPISTSKFASNRDLSTARARSVYEYIISEGSFFDANMKISGYGDSRPIANNNTAEGRAKNRRVVIKIYNQQNSTY